MKEKIIQYIVREYSSVDELPESDRFLLQASREAAEKAYAPYSGYRVGAAVLLANGEVLTGNNQENAAYPSGLCAERTVLFYASSQYPGVAVKALAVSAPGNGEQLDAMAKPCGACRQVIAEYEDLAVSLIRILLDGAPVTVLDGVDALMPMRFKNSDLKKK